MTEAKRNELFKLALKKSLSEIDERTTFLEREQILNVLSFVQNTTDEKKAKKAVKNEINFI